MITMQEFMDVVSYRITEGSDYCWSCYGSDAHTLDSWNGDHDGHSLSIIFDTKTQEVYEVQVHDYKNNRAYRLFNTEYKSAHDEEAKERGVDGDQAWDDTEYIDLEDVNDFIEKARAIVAGEDYDTRVSIPVDLPEDVLFTLMTMAHEKDITLNQLFEDVIRIEIDKIRSME
jgi:hypothetical protein